MSTLNISGDPCYLPLPPEQTFRWGAGEGSRTTKTMHWELGPALNEVVKGNTIPPCSGHTEGILREGGKRWVSEAHNKWGPWWGIFRPRCCGMWVPEQSKAGGWWWRGQGRSRLNVERLEDFWVPLLESRLSISAGSALPMDLLEAYKRRKTVRSFDSRRSPPKKEVYILFKFSDILDDSQRHSNTLLGQESKYIGTLGRRRGMQWSQARTLGSRSLASEMQLCNSHTMCSLGNFPSLSIHCLMGVIPDLQVLWGWNETMLVKYLAQA